MNILVIGGSGLVGSNCLTHFSNQKDTMVIGTFFSHPTENTVYYDTLNPDNPENYDVASYMPDVVVHCGALTHVDYCEDHEEESYQKTVQSTSNVIDLCEASGAKMVYISTDYVFDGLEGPYDENATVNPVSIYGKHKLEAENEVLSRLTDSIVIRITNVYGDEERKKNFIVRIVDQILQGEKLQLKLPFDQYATPVNAYDVARAVFELIVNDKSGVYNINSTDYLNRVELAEKILSHFPEAKYDMEKISTADLQQPAQRPLKGGLKNDKFMNEFPEFMFTTVDEYLDKFVT